VLIEIEIAIALGISLKVFNLLPLRTIRLFIYKLRGYLIYNTKKLRRIPLMPRLLPMLLFSLRSKLRQLLLILKVGPLRY
jgi:hypothetical protein